MSTTEWLRAELTPPVKKRLEEGYIQPVPQRIFHCAYRGHSSQGRGALQRTFCETIKGVSSILRSCEGGACAAHWTRSVEPFQSIQQGVELWLGKVNFASLHKSATTAANMKIRFRGKITRKVVCGGASEQPYTARCRAILYGGMCEVKEIPRISQEPRFEVHHRIL